MRSDALIRFWNALRRRSTESRTLYLEYSQASPPSTQLVRTIVAALGGHEYWSGTPGGGHPDAGKLVVERGVQKLDWGDHGLFLGAPKEGPALLDWLLLRGRGHIVTSLPDRDPATLPVANEGWCGSTHDCISALRPLVWICEWFCWRRQPCLGVSRSWKLFWAVRWAVPELHALRAARSENPFVESLIGRVERLAYVRAQLDTVIYSDADDARPEIDLLVDAAILLSSASLDTLACAVMWDHLQGSPDALRASFDLARAPFRAALSALFGKDSCPEYDETRENLAILKELRNFIAHRHSPGVRAYEGCAKPRFSYLDRPQRYPASSYDTKTHLIVLPSGLIEASHFQKNTLTEFSIWIRKSGGVPFILLHDDRVYIDALQMADTLFILCTTLIREVTRAMALRTQAPVVGGDDVLRGQQDALDRTSVAVSAAIGTRPPAQGHYLNSAQD